MSGEGYLWKVVGVDVVVLNGVDFLKRVSSFDDVVELMFFVIDDKVIFCVVIYDEYYVIVFCYIDGGVNGVVLVYYDVFMN